VRIRANTEERSKTDLNEKKEERREEALPIKDYSENDEADDDDDEANDDNAAAPPAARIRIGNAVENPAENEKKVVNNGNQRSNNGHSFASESAESELEDNGKGEGVAVIALPLPLECNGTHREAELQQRQGKAMAQARERWRWAKMQAYKAIAHPALSATPATATVMDEGPFPAADDDMCLPSGCWRGYQRHTQELTPSCALAGGACVRAWQSEVFVHVYTPEYSCLRPTCLCPALTIASGREGGGFPGGKGAPWSGFSLLC
jgi:hypothetical protein